MRRASVPALATLAIMVLTGGAAARPFGERGEYIITSDARLDFQRNTTVVEGEDDVTRTDYSFRIAGDYTRFPNITFGIHAGFDGMLLGRNDAVKGFGFGARGGYVVPLSTNAYVWPRLGLIYGNTTYQNAVDQFTVSSWRVSASVPVVFTPYPHIIAGLAPSYERDLSAKSGINDNSPVPKVSGFGVHLLMGFWFE